MPKLWAYNQAPQNYSPDPTVQSGVCMAMSYYVLKRWLAKLDTSPAMLNRKMGLFTSMQRAHVWNVKLSSIEWVKMLAKGDNLKATPLDYSDAINGDIENALKTAVTQAAHSGIYLSLKWKGSGHGIAVVADADPKTLSVFDPNLGLYDIRGEADVALFSREFDRLYTNPGRIGTVVLSGTPRDLKSLRSD